MYRLPVLLGLVFLLFPRTLGGQTSTARAEGVIQGLVVSESGQPLAAVAIGVRTGADSTIVARGVTGANGRFRIEGLPVARYRVSGSLLGYAPFSQREVTLTTAEPRADLGTITLNRVAISVEGVVARGERSAMVVAPDRTSYSTRDMPVASGGMATDVLRSVPELEVDIEGNVSLRGTGAQIYLNGRPAPMEGESLQLFLQQFPADRIERVEVIPNPSARFQAEGAAGIVNIVLKKNVDLGLSGSVFLNGGTRGDLGSGGRLTCQRGPLTLLGGGFLRLSRRDNTSYDLRQNLLTDLVTFLEQDGWSKRRGSLASVDVSAEYKLSGRSSFWAEVQLFRRGNDSDALTAYTLMDATRAASERYDRVSEDDARNISTDLVAGFRHVLEPRRHQLEMELRYERGDEFDGSLVRRLYLSPAGADLGLPAELTVQDETEDERELSFNLDYVRPWGNGGQVEVGYRGEFEGSDNERLLQVFPSEDASVPATVSERGFSHQETFHSVYLTLLRKFGPLSAQAGVRGELADTWFELPSGDRFENDYANLFPSANLRYDLGRGREVRLSYSKRLRRPGPRVLNPIDESTDPLNRRVGNPDIDPQYTHNLSLDASWSGQVGTLTVSPYYRQTVGDWTQIKTVDAAGISTVTWENLASVDAYGTSIRANLRPVRGIGGFLSASSYREVRDASNLSLDYSGASLRWLARGNLQAKLTPGLSLQGMGFYTPARDVPQGRISSRLMTHLGLRQQMWNDKASLNLMIRDPFDLYRSSFETRDRSHVQIGRSEFSMRSLALSFSYSFGRPPRNARGRGEDAPEQEPEPESSIR
jgi:hypothetical protein